MDVKVCKNCKRLFNYIYGPELCPECTKLVYDNKNNPNKESVHVTINPNVNDAEINFDQVRDYIMSNPRATVSQIAEANNIKPAMLFEWIREDRLEFSDDSAYAWFECEKCGAKIRSGRFCNRCKSQK